MIRQLYARVIALSATRWALPALAAVSFAESSFFPIPPDVLLAPMVLARRDKAWLYAFVCATASVVGGLFGYAIGVFLTPLASWIVGVFAHGQTLESYRGWFGEYGFWIILAKGLTPIPFKLVTIASGAFRFNLGLFVLAAAITRGGRFFLEAALLQHPKAQAFVDKNLIAILIGAGVLLVVTLAAAKLLHVG